MYEINKGIPIPAINRQGAGRRRKYPIETMEVGDQLFIPGRSSRSVSAYISRISKDVPGKFSARACWMERNTEGKWQLTENRGPPACEGTGVWRVE